MHELSLKFLFFKHLSLHFFPFLRIATDMQKIETTSLAGFETMLETAGARHIYICIYIYIYLCVNMVQEINQKKSFLWLSFF